MPNEEPRNQIPRMVAWKSRDIQEDENFIRLCRELAIYAYEGNFWTPALVARYREMVDTAERRLAERDPLREHEQDGEAPEEIVTRNNWPNDWVIPMHGLPFALKKDEQGRLIETVWPDGMPGPTVHYVDGEEEELRGDDKELTVDSGQIGEWGWSFSAAEQEPGITFGEWCKRVEALLAEGKPVDHSPPREANRYQLPSEVSIESDSGATISVPLPDMVNGDVVTIYHEPGKVMVHKSSDRRFGRKPADAPTDKNKGT